MPPLPPHNTSYNQRIAWPGRNSLCNDDRHFVKQQIREDRRPHETQMLRSDVRRRLSGSLDGRVAPNAIQLAVGLVNRVGIEAIITGGRHESIDHAVSKRY